MELVERDVYLESLQNGFNRISSGEGQCFFILGEPGIGKSALVKSFLSRIEKDSIQYIGACDSLYTPRPLAPLYDLALQIKETWAEKIYSISSRTELFTKFIQALGDKDKPVVMVFEDIHWADEATLDFVKYFSRRISRLKCLFILTCRDDEVSQQHALRNVLSDLSPDSFTRIQLIPLSREAVYKLAEQKGYDAANVYNISAGNPFYVNEILANYSPGVPDNIKDSILSVYERQEAGTKNTWQILSVIPEGLELKHFARIKSSWDDGMDHCFALKAIVVNNDKIIFKHELYRLTIENSLSPIKRIDLNKKIIELLLASFEEGGEIERIVHYAKNANENELVIKYAPLAAKQAAAVGSHIEASKLYLTAIEFSETANKDQLANLYDCYAHECYLTNQLIQAITYQDKALNIWQAKNEIEKIGNALCLLSRLYWLNGNSERAVISGNEAIRTFKSQPASKAKAMAFNNMSLLQLCMGDMAACIKWSKQAIAMAKEIKDEEVLCAAFNNAGSAQWDSGNDAGKKILLESLDIAVKNSFDEHAAIAFTNISSKYIQLKKYDLAKEVLNDALNYCEGKDLESQKNHILYLKAKMFFETGDWSGAILIINNLLSSQRQSVSIRAGSMIILATIQFRKGTADTFALLEEARKIVLKTKEYPGVLIVMTNLLEYEWLTGKKIITAEEFELCCRLVKKTDDSALNSQFAFWLKKTGREDLQLNRLYPPYKILKDGDVGMAADMWEKINCPFEKAIYLYEGVEADKRNALQVLQNLGADAVFEKIKMEMRSSGIRNIPRGLRESTKTNPAQLTNRELDVLQLLQKDAQNKEIAGNLFISPKTVDHHISSILFKLDVKSRSKAVSEAIRLGILK